MALPRAMAFARQKVSEAWKRLKATGVGKTIAGAKQICRAKMKKPVKIALINVF